MADILHILRRRAILAATLCAATFLWHPWSASASTSTITTRPNVGCRSGQACSGRFGLNAADQKAVAPLAQHPARESRPRHLAREALRDGGEAIGRLPKPIEISSEAVSRATGITAVRGAPMRFIYSAPESSLDRRYVYHWDILKTALEKTKAEYGPYVMQPSTFMTEKRQAFEMRQATGKLNVMYLSTTPDLERDLIPVRIPVDKNLGGYCVFLIRKDEKDRFKSVHSLDDLRQFTYGLGLGWIDVGILTSNGLKVVTGSNYDGLFYMLANGRMDIFLRAAVEVLDEYDERKAKIPNLCIEDSLILYYPLPMYFWFPRTKEGQLMADRVKLGMFKMIDDGSYDRIFFAYQGWKIRRLHLKSRRIFKINNPNLGPETPFGDKRLWFDPTRDSVPASDRLETH